MAQYGPKMALGCPIKNIEKPLVFIVFLRFRGVLCASLGAPWPPVGPKMAQELPPDAPKMAQHGPGWPKMAPR